MNMRPNPVSLLIAKCIAMAIILLGSTVAVAMTPEEIAEQQRRVQVIQLLAVDGSGRPAELLVPDERFVYTTCAGWRNVANQAPDQTAQGFLNSFYQNCFGRTPTRAIKVNLAEFDYFVQLSTDRNRTAHPAVVGFWEKAEPIVKATRQSLVASTPTFIAAYNADAEKIVAARRAKEAARVADEQRRRDEAEAARKDQQAREDAEKKRWAALTPAQRAEEEKQSAQRQMSELVAQCTYWRKFLDSGLEAGDYRKASQVATRMRAIGCTNYQY